MAEYIEREAAKQAIDYALDMTSGDYAALALAIDNISAANVAPVVHGKWLLHYRSGTGVGSGWVSSCCDMWNFNRAMYCPNCGARMDGGVDHAAD